MNDDSLAWEDALTQRVELLRTQLGARAFIFRRLVHDRRRVRLWASAPQLP